MIGISEYLAGAATSRALYQWLFRDAAGMLPKVGDPRAELPAELVSQTPLAVVASELTVSLGVVKRDLARLVNLGWVRQGAPRFLGRRDGGYHLIADVAAESATGEVGVVSRVVLQLKPERQTSAARREDARGTNRRWESEGGEWEWGGRDAKANP